MSRKPHTHLSPEQGARLVGEAAGTLPGSIPDLCKRYDISTETLERWREKVAADPRLNEIAEQTKSQLLEHWRDEAVAAQRAVLLSLQKQAELAGKLDTFSPDAMHKLAGAGKILGELLIGSSVVLPNGGTVRNLRKDPPVATAPGLGARAAGGSGAGAAEGVNAPVGSTGSGTGIH
jgi:hypothetical protein